MPRNVGTGAFFGSRKIEPIHVVRSIFVFVQAGSAMNRYRMLILAACILVGAAVLVGVLASGLRRTGRSGVDAVFTGETQGTTYSIKIATAPLSVAQRQAVDAAIRQRLDRIDRVMSNYIKDSELVRFNEQQSIAPVRVSQELIDVMQAARVISEASGGAFDVTVAPLVEAWGFGPAKKRDAVPPSDTEIAKLLERVGYEKIEIDAAAGTLRKTRPDVVCDLNGIAQGDTVDKLAETLRSMGYERFMVEVGGEVKARGRNAGGEFWRVAIEKPTDEGRELQEVLALDDLGLTTAGDYRNYTEQNGQRICHIIDPRTGRPITHTLASVSVVHADCTVADGYDTALLALGPDKGFELAVKKGLAALFISRDPQLGFETQSTPQFDALTRARH